jgi:hypothetical protein
MKRIVSQIAGAAAVVAAVGAGFAYAQTTESSSTSSTTTRTVTPAKSEDLKSNSTDSRYGAGANNGSTYNPAIRSTDIKAGNVSNVDDPTVTTTTTTTTATPMPRSTTGTSTSDSSTYTATPAASTDSGHWNADGTRAARADRN